MQYVSPFQRQGGLLFKFGKYPQGSTPALADPLADMLCVADHGLVRQIDCGNRNPTCDHGTFGSYDEGEDSCIVLRGKQESGGELEDNVLMSATSAQPFAQPFLLPIYFLKVQRYCSHMKH